MNVEKENYNGKEVKYVTPQITTVENDATSIFINKYRNRFEYICLNKIDSISRFAQYFPNTQKIDSEFCNYINETAKFKEYINVLLNKNQQKIEFTYGQMMKIASRFFLCDRINEKDSSIGYHICIGINGQKELKSDLDYTILEAFCFEAIFDALSNQETPLFVRNFQQQISLSVERNKRIFRNKNEYLENIKNECFYAMENDNELLEHLTQYYRNNQASIGIKLK
jgi:hypothetical protein